jgi:hypothetical protein
MAIEGSLESVDIQDVVQLLNINQSSGLLHIESRQVKGVLTFASGEIIGAQSPGKQGDAAAYVLLAQAEGRFSFQQTSQVYERTIHKTIHDLVLEAARRKDTIQNIRGSITNDNIIFFPLIDPGIPSIAKDLSSQERNVLALLDGQKDIRELVQQSQMEEIDVLQVLFELEQQKKIKRLNVFKVLEVHTRKALFGKPKDVVISESVWENWKNESRIFARANIVEIRTQKMIYGQMEFVAKASVPSDHILVPDWFKTQLQIASGDRVLVKPMIVE